MENNDRLKLAFNQLITVFKSYTYEKKSEYIRQLDKYISASDEKIKQELLDLRAKLENDNGSISATNLLRRLELIKSFYFDHTLPQLTKKVTQENASSEVAPSANDSISKTLLGTSSPIISQPQTENFREASKKSEPQISEFNFKRPDGSILKIEYISHKNNIYFPNLGSYKITQTFPNLRNLTVSNIIYTSIDISRLQTDADYALKISNSLSPDNIYKAVSENSGLLYSGNPDFESNSAINSDTVHHDIDSQIRRVQDDFFSQKLASSKPFYEDKQIIYRLIPIGIFHTQTRIYLPIRIFTIWVKRL